MDSNAVKTLAKAESSATGSRKEFVSNVAGKAIKAKGKVKGKKKAPLIVVLVLLIAMPIMLFSSTVLYPFHLAANLVQKVMVLYTTVKEWALNAIDTLMSKGKMPKKLKNELEENGIEVGAVTATGEFINTDQVIAEGEEYIVAVSDGAMFKVESGKLSVRFMGEIIPAGEFAAAAKSNYRLYNAVTEAIGGQSAIFYDRAGQEAFDELGINRDPYRGFESTGDAEADQESFEKMFADLLDYTADVNVGNVSTCEGGTVVTRDASGEEHTAETCTIKTEAEGAETDNGDIDKDLEGDESEAVGNGASAEEYVQQVASRTKGNNKKHATSNAAALLNAAVSSNEPLQAAKAASGVIIAAERAKAGDNGPINEMANMMMRTEESSYSDPASGEKKTVEMSPAESTNMSAVTAAGEFSAEVASRYSRDRLMSTTTNVASISTHTKNNSTSNTLVSSKSLLKRFTSWVGMIFLGKSIPDTDTLMQTSVNTIDDALIAKPSETMLGESLGERVVEGAAYINATMARKIGGAGASDDAAIAEYSRQTQDMIALEKEADRAKRSPFDATSPNTFLGSIVNSTFNTIVRSKSVAGGLSGVANTAGSSLLATIGGSVYADGSEETYATSYGDCTTLTAITGAQGDLYCNQNPTFDMSLAAESLDFYESKLSDVLTTDESGHKTVKEDSKLQQYLIFGTERQSSPGVKDAGICDALSTGDEEAQSGWKKVINTITGAIGLGNAGKKCTGKRARIATGEEYANTASNKEWDTTYKYYQGYVMETYVLELLGYYDEEEGNGKNPVVAAKDAYYEKNPLDQSYAGVIARYTGMDKEDVIAGVEGLRYLAYLESYDPSERYAFFTLPEEPEFEPEMDEHKVVSDNKQRDSKARAIA